MTEIRARNPGVSERTADIIGVMASLELLESRYGRGEYIVERSVSVTPEEIVVRLGRVTLVETDAELRRRLWDRLHAS